MTDSHDTVSPSGVRLAGDFRDNLIIDRFDPLFCTIRASKRAHMRSENSEDAVTWNVFRTLRQIDPAAWLNDLFRAAFPSRRPESHQGLAVYVWRSVAPPPALVVDLDENPSEIDVVLETPQWVWFIEAKYRSDIAIRTTNRPARDQILRNIDVGSFYAGVRRFYFSLLIAAESRSPVGVDILSRYEDIAVPRQLLQDHRPDGLENLQGVSRLAWANLGEVLGVAQNSAKRDDERGYATRALQWLQKKGLVEVAG